MKQILVMQFNFKVIVMKMERERESKRKKHRKRKKERERRFFHSETQKDVPWLPSRKSDAIRFHPSGTFCFLPFCFCLFFPLISLPPHPFFPPFFAAQRCTAQERDRHETQPCDEPALWRAVAAVAARGRCACGCALPVAARPCAARRHRVLGRDRPARGQLEPARGVHERGPRGAHRHLERPLHPRVERL